MAMLLGILMGTTNTGAWFVKWQEMLIIAVGLAGVAPEAYSLAKLAAPQKLLSPSHWKGESDWVMFMLWRLA